MTHYGPFAYVGDVFTRGAGLRPTADIYVHCRVFTNIFDGKKGKQTCVHSASAGSEDVRKPEFDVLFDTNVICQQMNYTFALQQICKSKKLVTTSHHRPSTSRKGAEGGYCAGTWCFQAPGINPGGRCGSW